ncbi:MAG: heparinase II/III family protein [Verrucomicrobia bacterium]|nr:heparinase II/III family protein [Verrucomicrobiota bacterium]
MKTRSSARRHARPLKLTTMAISLACLTINCAGLAGSKVTPARSEEIAKLLPPKPAGFGSPIADRAVWEKLAAIPEAKKAIADAEQVAAKTIPEQPDALFLDFSKTGNRDRWQTVAFERRRRIEKLTLGEGFENQGRFIKPLELVIAELCREKTWVYPAHDKTLANFNGKAREMDLGAVFVAMELAEADYLLGDKLSARTRQLLRDNVRQRVLYPFREMAEGKAKEMGWMRSVNNWNAVCLGSITIAALALEEAPTDRAAYVAAAEHYIRSFLNGFTPDGYCSEGVGYWNYGFGHYIMLAEAVRRATNNKLDLMADPAAMQPALFCVRSEIINGLFPTIADCSPGSRPDPRMTAYVCRRFDLGLAACEGKALRGPGGGLAATMMTASFAEPLPIVRSPENNRASPLRTWFPDGGVLICRPADGAPAEFAAVLKGGHNAELHNHNDVGSFSVVLGDRMLICDPGGEVYTARTFSGQRYESKVLNSFGHPVPVVDGQLQQTGAAARGVVLQKQFSESEDSLKLDLRSAYPAKALRKLERTFVFRRGAAPALSVTDDVAFEAKGHFETALVTWGQWKRAGADAIVITDGGKTARVEIATGGVPFEIRAETLDEDVRTPKKPVRLGIALKEPVASGHVTLRIRPLP